MKKDTSLIGNITESAVLGAFFKLGCSVSIPFGNNQRYDLIVDIRGKLFKVQCKTALLKNGVLGFWTVSSEKASSRNTIDYHGDVDLFGVYNREINKVYIIPVSEIKSETCSLRIDETKNNQQKHIRWAKNYEIEKIIMRM